MADRFPAEVGTNARLKIGVGGVATSARRWLDLVAGTGVSLTPVDDGVNEKVSVTVAVTGAPPTGNAGGDLTGTYPNPTIGAGKVVTAGILDANVTTAKIADANVTLAKLASEAWTGWTPTVTSGTGTITTVGAVAAASAKIGRTVAYRAAMNITTNGTGASWILFTLPYNCAGANTPMGSGVEQAATGKGLTVVGSDATHGLIRFYDGLYPGSSGALLLVSGTYDATS